jgi:DNA invertase Pin-like site-specific DNA recombinase
LFIRAYLRASTADQDGNRARDQLETFAAERDVRIAAFYVENESGARLARPELFRLLRDSQPGDVLLIEQVDRLSRLTESDWRKLRSEIDARQIRIVALDLPTSWSLTTPPDDFTGRMFAAVNAMLLDMLAAVARKDYEDRRRRQAQGQAKAKAEGLYKGRKEDSVRNAGIAAMLQAGSPWSQILAATGCSRSTISKVRKRLNAESKGTVPALEPVAALPLEFDGPQYHFSDGQSA